MSVVAFRAGWRVRGQRTVAVFARSQANASTLVPTDPSPAAGHPAKGGQAIPAMAPKKMKKKHVQRPKGSPYLATEKPTMVRTPNAGSLYHFKPVTARNPSESQRFDPSPPTFDDQQSFQRFQRRSEGETTAPPPAHKPSPSGVVYSGPLPMGVFLTQDVLAASAFPSNPTALKATFEQRWQNYEEGVRKGHKTWRSSAFPSCLVPRPWCLNPQCS